ncbi:mycofactocin system transcriptional regulator [Nocardioides sp. zg-DK7169]|uniref:mycofactocin system transcriptional regulator n=1 Tax=Nocardioides sp. zg-DK7169 TaxID=2736600 RepID=UPI001556C92C|nr:mycofactocin system transcriptional regulator [Nocardioides sp. zg-DK7169]NPC96085.1 mycofactocin system transcriptional regulator [Nocardioides sp. zg-DK7169]
MARPEATSHAAIEQAAFALFKERGFEATTLDAIAEAVGVGRRTLFRYYQSKNDIPWGRFDLTLEGFRELLRATPEGLGVYAATARAIVEFNRFPVDASPPHAERMRLILRTPALQAHSALRYAEWRRVIAEYAAAQLDVENDALEPRLLGHVGLALALTAYETWLDDPSRDVTDLLREGTSALAALAAS